MLKRLRVKFIALNMVMVFAVLLVVFTSICVLDYQQSIARVNVALDGTLSRVGFREDFHGPKGLSFADEDWDDEAWWEEIISLFDDLEETSSQVTSEEVANLDTPLASSGASEADSSAKSSKNASINATETALGTDDAALAEVPYAKPPRIGGRGESETAIPVAAYVLEDGELEELPMLTTASIDAELLQEAAAEAQASAEDSGKLSGLGLYFARKEVDGALYFAFADASLTDGWMRLALILAGVGVVALAAFFVISLFFSRWALRPVAEAWERQRQFVADASHDLKTPLTVILANAAILAEHPERTVQSQMQWVEGTEHEARAMQGLVNDLLELAKIDEAEAVGTGALPAAQTGRVDLSNVVEGELLQMESLAFEAEVVLTDSVHPGVFVDGVPSQLRRVVVTLLDNAVKYAGAGNEVSVNLHAKGRDAVLTVHNTGPAIAPEDLPHIFDRFYRADKARNRDSASGHGLGLAIADAVAREHGGTLTADSAEGRGTTFTLTLPLAKRDGAK